MNLRTLDCLRGLLAVYVVIGHARFLLWEGWSSWKTQDHPFWADLLAASSGLFRYGHEAVMVFFVLSGFFIHLRAATPLVSRDTSWKFNIKAYVTRRAHRIVPTYLFALLITVLCDIAGRKLFPALYLGTTGFADIDAGFQTKGYDKNSITWALLLLPSCMGRDFGSNGPLWSLGCEMVYYAVYPVWLWVRRIHRVTAFLVVFAIGICAAVFLTGGPIRTLLQHYPCWIAGAATAEWVVRRGVNLPRTMFVTLGAVLLGCSTIDYQLPAGFHLLAHCFLGVGAILLFTSLQNTWTEKIGFRLMEHIGFRSYTLYACHFPILTLMAAGQLRASGERPASGWLAACGVAVAVLTCMMLFELCEKHFIHPRIHLNPDSTPG